MKELWVEKYRPKTLKEYVVRDDAQRQQIQTWINDKAIPHLLLSGAPGVGKTTLAKDLFAHSSETGDMTWLNTGIDHFLKHDGLLTSPWQRTKIEEKIIPYL